MKSVSATNARVQWSDLIQQAGIPGSSIAIRHRDRPDVVMIPYEDYEGLTETIEILIDSSILEQIQKGLSEISSGKRVTLDTVKKRLNM